MFSFICDSQLLFNPMSKICDFPINVACLEKEIYRVDENTRSQLLARMKELNVAVVAAAAASQNLSPDQGKYISSIIFKIFIRDFSSSVRSKKI